MIAYLKVIHLFLSLPTPMWFSNPEVIMFWQKFIGTSVFSLRSAGHCVTLTAALQRSALEKPGMMAHQVQVYPYWAVRWHCRQKEKCPPSPVPLCLALCRGSVWGSGLDWGSGLGGRRNPWYAWEGQEEEGWLGTGWQCASGLMPS